VDAIVRTIAAERREGDIVVLMSNGGFGGIHQKLLHALNDADRPAASADSVAS
jgi:UDP-N-acetylmuramate: L-alanyl-gamma-D-glutamyl-meso-diaminopimelate ligase